MFVISVWFECDGLQFKNTKPKPKIRQKVETKQKNQQLFWIKATETEEEKKWTRIAYAGEI